MTVPIYDVNHDRHAREDKYLAVGFAYRSLPITIPAPERDEAPRRMYGAYSFVLLVTGNEHETKARNEHEDNDEHE